MKHTPAPWTITESNLDLYDIGISGPQLDGSGDTWIICDITNDGFEDETNKANAKLIAAAPELLNALIYANRFLKAEEVDKEYVESVIKKAITE